MFEQDIDKSEQTFYTYLVNKKRKDPDTVLAHHGVSGVFSNKHKHKIQTRKAEFVNTAEMLQDYYTYYLLFSQVKYSKYFCKISILVIIE